VTTFVLGIIPVWVLSAIDHADLAHPASRAAFPRLSDQAELWTGLRAGSPPCVVPSELGRFA